MQHIFMHTLCSGLRFSHPDSPAQTPANKQGVVGLTLTKNSKNRPVSGRNGADKEGKPEQ
jgi:hypothetical protein